MNTSRCWLDEAAGRLWHACVHCEVHGWVDEDVAWSDARTAHKACEIARARHYDCDGVRAQRQADAERGFAVAQINAAGWQLQDFEQRLAAAEADLAKAKSAQERADAEAIVQQREIDVGHARKRLDDVIDSNGAALPGPE